MDSLPSFMGMPVYEDSNLYDTHRKQVRFPRSKRARIRRKWAKQEKNFKVWITGDAARIGNRLHVHPTLMPELRRQFGQRKEGSG